MSAGIHVMGSAGTLLATFDASRWLDGLDIGEYLEPNSTATELRWIRARVGRRQ